MGWRMYVRRVWRYRRRVMAVVSCVLVVFFAAAWADSYFERSNMSYLWPCSEVRRHGLDSENSFWSADQAEVRVISTRGLFSFRYVVEERRFFDKPKGRGFLRFFYISRGSWCYFCHPTPSERPGMLLPMGTPIIFEEWSMVGVHHFEGMQGVVVVPHAALTGLAALPCAWIGVGALRRWRAGRGGCWKCGYSREGLPEGAVCPECGSGAMRRS